MKFEIKDLAHIDHARFNDDKDITVIVGDNGSGKTILLETLLLVKQKKKELISNLVSVLRSSSELLNISFGNGEESITEFLLEEEIKIRRTSLTDLDSIKEEAFISFNSNDKEFEWEGNIKFTLKNTQIIEKLINEELKKLQKNLPKMISEEILFNLDDEAKIKISDEKIVIKEHYDINISFKSMSKNQFWRMEWIDSKKLSRREYEIQKKRRKPIDSFKSMLTKILYEYIFEQSLGFSTDSEILMVPTERSQLMLSTNEDFKNLLENKTNRMRYSESSFLKDYFSRKDIIPSLPLTDTFEEMLGGEIQFDIDGNITGLVDELGEEIDWRLFSTKQNRMIPYLLVEYLSLSNELQLIIEEPESNLSLKSIREIVNYIIELITSKPYPVKIILTTHSDVFFQILNLKLLKNNLISSRVYEFQKKKSKNVLIECVPNEYGYSTELFGNELDNLYLETQKIQSYIDESGSQVEILDIESSGGSEK